MKRLTRLLRLRDRQRRGKPTSARVATVTVFFLAGLMITVSALASRGQDLRPDRSTDLVQLIKVQSDRVNEQRQLVKSLQADIDALGSSSGETIDRKALAQAESQLMLTALKGPAVEVVLSDAPLDVKPAGVHDDLLVVHEQDIRAVTNAFWAGGAEAIMVQNQRINPSTNIKCVGNSVVLHGVPYAPPYRIVAIGDVQRLQDSLLTNQQLRIYREYVEAYALGYQVIVHDEVEIPAFDGVLEIKRSKLQEP